MPDQLAPILVKLMLLIKTYMPGIVGTTINFFLKQHLRAVKGLHATTWGAKLGTAVAGFLIGLGCVWIAEAYVVMRHFPPNPTVLKAVMFIGSMGGVELIFWIVGKVDRASDMLEDAYIENFLKSRGKINDKEKASDSK